MKKFVHFFLNMFKWIAIILLSIIVIFLICRFIGQKVNSKTLTDGINENMYVDINGTKQWISIYGQNKDNPVLLYLHGGPGSSTSLYDYAFTRKWSDVYTVVTWDQINCGKSYSSDQNDTILTYDLMMSDSIEITKYLLDYLGKDKITLLGHSWETYLGSNLALQYPEYYECYIGTGQLVDFYQNEVAFKEEAVKWVGNDKEDKQLIEKLTIGDFSMEYYGARNALMEKYRYDIFADGTDYNLITTQIFNPYYSLWDFYKYINADFSIYENFLNSEEFSKFSLLGKTDYQIPFYNINGDKDYQTNYLIAQEYFDSVIAPYKKMYIMKDTTHGLLESKSEEFSEILHEIAEIEKRK
ncbi:MAG: alpha/beta hydrolase [Prevotella sp.]|nr:alpha/beta hydrolase [Alistipes senegalensis]MCM1357806.1 alpha/beta hydrolase [Prevotella sp.]